MNILLITPPFTQLNTPYPATTQLKAFLVQEGHTVKQYDMGIELANQIFTRSFLKDIFDIAFSLDKLSFKARGIASKRWAYEKSIDNVWRFLQGKDETLATKITTRGYLPEAGRFKNVKDENLEWAFGSTGNIDRAKHLATLYIEDLSDFIADIVSSSFQLV
ncbi:MAG: radical SAM protein, partial [Rikenellaceae bacterium]